MPGEALRIGAADNALPPESISEILVKTGSKIMENEQKNK
jgi:chemotaxis response regulator CheB